MPPKKRALAESDANSQPAPKNQKKNQAKDADNEAEHAHEDDHERKHKEIECKNDYDWICIDAPSWCVSSYDSGDDDEADEDDEPGQRAPPEKSNMFLKPASEHPTWKWVMMWKSWGMLCDWMRKASYTDPDSFGMYIYNDFNDYGLTELVENLLADFEKAKNKHPKASDKKSSLLDMWAPIATLAHFINSDMGASFQRIDDGERTSVLIYLIGCALVTMLETLNKEKHLSKDGEFRDVGLVISLYLNFADGQEEYGIGEEDVEWRSYLIPYAQKAGYDRLGLVAAGCDATGVRWEENEGQVFDAEVKKAGKKFDFTKAVREYKRHHCAGHKLGGEQHNIMKMSRSERASYAFDKKDPLAAFSDKDIKEGNLALGPA